MTSSYLTILLKAFRSLALTTHVVRTCGCDSSWTSAPSSNNPWFEGIGVFRSCVFHGLISHLFVFLVVVAVVAITSAAKQFCSKTFTIELETSGLLAITRIASII